MMVGSPVGSAVGSIDGLALGTREGVNVGACEVVAYILQIIPDILFVPEDGALVGSRVGTVGSLLG